MVSREVFSESDIVLRRVKLFSEVSNNFQTLFCLNHFILIAFDYEVRLCRYYPLTLDNIFKLGFIVVAVVVFIALVVFINLSLLYL